MADKEFIIDWDIIEEEILKEYWKKISHNQKIPNNEYIKKPYIESYLFDYVEWNSKIEIEDIPYEDIFLYIKNNYSCKSEEKSNIQKYLYVHSMEENKLTMHVICYMIEYLRFYMTMIDLLYQKETQIELSTFIYIILNHRNKIINDYKKKNLNFIIFYNLLNKTYDSYKNMLDILIQKKLIEEITITKSLFYKNIFSPWIQMENPEYDKSIESTEFLFSFSNLLCMNHE